MDSPLCEENADGQPKRASFRGRLQLHQFLFRPNPASPEASLAITQSPSPSPLRRSPRNPTPLGPVLASPNRVTKTRAAKPTTASNLSTATAAAVVPSHSPSSSSPKAQKTTSLPRANRRRQPTGYAPPSTYAHLSPLVDILAPDLLILFVGLNPGLETARSGHVYAHPSNLFWKLLYSSGITPRLCSPTEDRELPALYGLGNTNIVSRPSRNGSELSKAEMDEGVGVLEEKVRSCRPETVCIVGKSIWESIWRVRHGRTIKKDEFRYGWQDEVENMGVVLEKSEMGLAWRGAKVFVATSTSGLAAALKPAEKETIWRELGVWCERRRFERRTG